MTNAGTSTNQLTGDPEGLPVIEIRLNSLHACIEDTASVLTTLVARLGPVLQPCGKEVVGTQASAPRPILSPLAERVENEIDHIQAIAACIRGINSRLEV